MKLKSSFLKLILALTVPALVVSCTDSDSGSTNTQKTDPKTGQKVGPNNAQGNEAQGPLVGQWKLLAYSVDGQVRDDMQGSLNLKADGNYSAEYVFQGQTKKESGTWKFNQDQLTLDAGQEGATEYAYQSSQVEAPNNGPKKEGMNLSVTAQTGQQVIFMFVRE